MEQVKHERLSEALCEAVKFGRPTEIKMGNRDFDALRDSLGPLYFDKLSFQPLSFEGVRLGIERDRTGCIVEHDGRYDYPSEIFDAKAIPETVAFDRKTRAPVIVAW